MDPSANPFAALSFIVAPAILTNASSVLAMSTSNRLARAVDRARELLRPGVGSLGYGSLLLGRETRLAVDNLQRRVEAARRGGHR